VNKKVPLSILIALVIANATWVATSGHSDPVIALIFYALVAFGMLAKLRSILPTPGVFT